VLAALAPEIASVVAQVASDVALVIDGDGVIRSVAESPAAGADAGARGWDGWVGRRWVDTASPGNQGKLQLLLDEARVGSTTTRRREVNHPTAGGHDVPLAWTAVRLGQTGPVVAVGRDLRAVAAIQQRFLDAQQEIERDYWRRREAEGRYQRLFRVARDAVLVLDAQTFELLDANDAAVALFGASAEPTVGASAGSWPQRLPEPARAAMQELLLTARRSGRAAELRVHGCGLEDGQPIDCDVSATPFRVGQRVEFLLRAHAADPEAGRVDADRLAAYVESTADAVAVVDSAGRVQMANAAFVGLVDHGSEVDLRGQRFLDLLADDDPRWTELVARARERGMCRPRVLTTAARSGRRRVLVGASLLTDGEQEAVGITLRTLAAAPPWQAATTDSAPTWLAEIEHRLGRDPLSALVADAQRLAERHLVNAALLRSHGDAAACAGLLGLDGPGLAALFARLGLGPVARPRDGDPTRPH
jgi:transcriptional regulator PpsR